MLPGREYVPAQRGAQRLFSMPYQSPGLLYDKYTILARGNCTAKPGQPTQKGGILMDDKNQNTERKDDLNQIVELGSDISKNSKSNIYTLTICQGYIPIILRHTGNDI